MDLLKLKKVANTRIRHLGTSRQWYKTDRKLSNNLFSTSPVSGIYVVKDCYQDTGK